MASAEAVDGDCGVVELIVRDASASEADAAAVVVSEEITPLLNQVEEPKLNIFTVTYPRRKLTEQVTKFPEAETYPLTQFVLWVWGGSRYSGLLCVAISSILYFFMEVISDVVSVQPIPLFETAFTRCTIIMILSYIWLRKCGYPVFGQSHVRKLLILRALMGYLSLMSYIYCIQRLPLSQAIVLSFTTPIMASVAARIILHEKLKISDIGGLACSFFGVLFIFRQLLTATGGLGKAGEDGNTYLRGSHYIYVVFVGLLSSITGGVSYPLIRAGAKASDQPVVTVFSFVLLAVPAAGMCTFAFEDFVLPGFNSFTLMLVLGFLAFLAEVFLARGLQLEKTSKAANILFIEVPFLPLTDFPGEAPLPPFKTSQAMKLLPFYELINQKVAPEGKLNHLQKEIILPSSTE
ncbi:Solute carrier family 35 member G1 [Morella rubra]|uniref:Solute carrier family 35 member G1 n=1 Tax=Morella rubra TaxID=262757 RepID=A0A6A1UQK1_9ROSI|nr:Solute carrier family 35 member G1 [Morella rubra]KAB1202597.1 Solute carrier family 35 member G1 [Morella rubra]